MRQLSLRRLDVSDSRHHHTKALIYVTAVELSQSILTCLLFSLSPNTCKAIWTAFNSNSLMCNWLSVLIVILYLCCLAVKLAFTLALLSSVRVIVINTESRTKPKNVIRCAVMTDDLCTLITHLKLENNVCVSEILSRHSLVSLPWR